MGLDRYHKTPCGFCFVEYYTHQDTLDCLKYIGGTKLDERIIRADLDPGFEEGRQYGYVERHSKLLRGIREYCFLTGETVGASLVARCAMNIAKNTILVGEVMVEHTMISADGKKKSMGQVSKRDLGFDLLAHRRRLYKDNFYQQKAEMKKEKESLSDTHKSMQKSIPMHKLHATAPGIRCYGFLLFFFRDSSTWRNHHECILASPVSSGWKLVPKTLPCRTAIMSPVSLSASIFFPSLASLAALPGRLASTSTWCAIASRAASSLACLDGATIVSSLTVSSTWTPSWCGKSFSTTGARIKTAGNELCCCVESRNGKSNGA